MSACKYVAGRRYGFVAARARSSNSRGRQHAFKLTLLGKVCCINDSLKRNYSLHPFDLVGMDELPQGVGVLHVFVAST